MPEPVVGVILLNWNGYDDTVAALESLAEARPRPAVVVVADNGSSDDSVERLAQWAEAHDIANATLTAPEQRVSDDMWLRIVLVGQNRGYAGGNNVGLRHLAGATDATHFLLLNNDALVAPDYFARIGEALATAPDAGLVGCAIFRHPETDRVWYAGGYEVRRKGVMLHHETLPDEMSPRPTEFVTGCAMLISRTAYDRLGGLGECYFPLYCEDGEYSFRARAAGFPVILAPAARVYHKVGGSVGEGEVVPRVALWQNRHRLFFVRRNYRGRERLIALGYVCVARGVRAALEVVRGRGAMGLAIWRGLYHGLVDDPA